MTTETKLKQQIYQIIESLPAERLPDLLRFLKQFLQRPPVEPPANAAPVYQLHHHAIDTGISDLAAQHDHYLYSANENDA